ncbi:two-component sensor histidine kinase [Sphaerisporangium rufum]|uniref:histidine kinase n=1 Tax=Sphaerisporangium rufum TaxID=1381558 RepID=A0A919V1U3_9ACTN|nr:HAMP domain-containing sensor histidine kinase [Sphaerisporangium rufum]GII81431.1 two-component sensor histidine kinase [Sphaerisporangium rufum]
MGHLPFRLRPESIRGRITLLTVAVTVAVLVPMALALSAVLRQVVTESVWRDMRTEATAVAAAVRTTGRVPPAIKPVPGVELIQVVAPDGRVLAASPAARGRPALGTVWPERDDPVQNVETCPAGAGCLRLSAARVTGQPDSPVVYAARQVTTPLSTGLITPVIIAQSVALAALAGWATWRIAGRTLRPVEVIRTQLAEITFRDLHGRVPEPEGADEVARLARTVNRTLDRLEHSVRVQRQFAVDASHELRTPLAGLRLELEEALMHPEESQTQTVLKQALGDVDRLQQIVSDLLYLAGFEAGRAGRMDRVDLAGLVREEVGRRVDRIPIRTLLEPGATVDAVGSQLSRVLANLLDNAQRHARGLVQVEVCRDGDQALLAVTDDGDGIPPADRERIFERFTRLDTARSRDRGGTGLGLAITEDVVRAHSGSVRVVEGSEGGARFEVRLPLAGVIMAAECPIWKPDGPPAGH